MSDFITPSLLITDYYDSLISQLDIYIEEITKEINEKGLAKIKTNQIYVKPSSDKLHQLINLSHVKNTITLMKIKCSLFI